MKVMLKCVRTRDVRAGELNWIIFEVMIKSVKRLQVRRGDEIRERFVTVRNRCNMEKDQLKSHH